jgi:hypothetical protein
VAIAENGRWGEIRFVREIRADRNPFVAWSAALKSAMLGSIAQRRAIDDPTNAGRPDQDQLTGCDATGSTTAALAS